jgi:regulator of sigma E protease
MSSTEILIAILGFNVLIVVHELGHFLVARLSGMRVLKFSIGFGPAIIRVRGKETVYQFAAIPVGGFVQIAGMMEKDYSEGSYLTRPLWQRGLTVFAGPLFNFALAALIYIGLFSTFTSLTFEWDRVPSPTVREVEGPAAAAGMQPFDTIVKIDDTVVKSFRDIGRAVGASDGSKMRVEVVRPREGRSIYDRRNVDSEAMGLRMDYPVPDPDGERIVLEVQPEKASRGWRLGIAAELARFGAADFTTAVKFAGTETWSVISTMVAFVGKALKGEEKVQLASVVKITQMGADTVHRGWEWFLNLLALLSINLGFLNLLPLPALDGGRLVFVFYEAIAGKPAPRRVEGIIHATGMVLLMGLILIVTAKDIIDLF